jgi:hypothetical protein
VSIALAILLVARFDGGVAGLCAGILAGRFLLTVVYPWQIGRTIGYPLVDQVRAAIRPVATTALLFGAAMVIGSEALSGSWLTVGSAAVLTAAVAAAAAAWLGLTRGQRATLYRRTRAVAGRG